MKRDIILSVLIIISVLVFGVMFVIAEDAVNATNSTSALNGTKTLNVTEDWSKLCSDINARVDGKINAFEDGKNRRAMGLFNILEVISRIEQRAKTANIDTSQLDSDFVFLNQSIEIFKTDYALFIEKLNNTKNYTCGHSQGQYMNALSEARPQLKIVKADLDSIKDFTNSVIKQDIQALRENIKNQTAEQRQNRLDAVKNMTQKIKDIRNQTFEQRQKLMEDMRNKIKEIRGNKIPRQQPPVPPQMPQ
jgi:hypothetical protein